MNFFLKLLTLVFFDLIDFLHRNVLLRSKDSRVSDTCQPKNPLLHDNQIQELIRVHQHSHSIFLESSSFTRPCSVLRITWDPSLRNRVICSVGLVRISIGFFILLIRRIRPLEVTALSLLCLSLSSMASSYAIVKNYIEKRRKRSSPSTFSV